jgi:hypothetical protein
VKRIPIVESVLLLLAIVVMAVVGILQAQRNHTAVESYSTYDSESGGFRAWYQLVEREGLRTGRFEERAAFLDRYTQALVIGASPISLDTLTAIAPGNGSTVASWVRDGGRLLVVGNGPLAGFVSFDLHLAKTAEPGVKRGTKPFVAPSLARFGVRDVDAGNGPRLILGKGQTALLSDRRGVLIERHALGHGEVVQLVDGTLFRNADIGTPDRARLAFALASFVAQSDPLAFDETVHGYLTPEHWWQVLPRRFVLAILFAGIVLLIAFTGAAIRLGPPRVLAPPPAPTSAEYLDALTALMERARAAAASLAQALRSTRQMLAARFGIPEDAPAALVAERIERKDLRKAFLELDALSREVHPVNASVVRGLALAYQLREEYARHAAGR